MPTASPLLRQTHPDSAGGAENQVLMLARALVRRNFRVAIATLADGVPLVAQVDGVDVVPQPASPMSAPVIRTVMFWILLVRTLLANPSKVIVQRSANIHTAPVAVMARLLGTRFVFASAGLRDFDRAAWKRRHRVPFDLGVRLAHEVVVQSDEQVPLCRKRFDRRPLRIKSIAEPASFEASDPDAFLWIGRLAHHKRPTAYLELARVVPEARFRMVAVDVPAHEQGLAFSAIERMAADLPNLDVLRSRQRRELVPLYESSVAVVSTSISEGMPNVFLEGWSRGVPAVALSHDPDGVIQSERLGAFAHGSPTRLAEIARTIWEQRNDRDDLAARCRAYVAREHAIGHVTDEWIRALELGATRCAPGDGAGNPLQRLDRSKTERNA
ncbi:MAG: glycosyltransferase family 4 protein [Solirubrobacteraceae bacterium]